ncbi:MAG TPA: ROK family protein [Spirochaetota bacterium]|nr:ROK family protein [Spirochaetota bacterium]HOL56553.1 ROK family protein [Spirochaetota bacterium]HPP03984.1 ROK family protein [Spirochaetota bacterium]
MSDKLYIGIDIGGTSAKIGLVTKNGEIKEKTQVKTIKSAEWKEIIDEYIIPIQKWIEQGYKIEGIGIGAPGFVNKETGTIHNCENIPGLINAPFVKYLEDKFKVKVLADNDATCAAIGEHIFGAGKDFTDFLMVTVGTGIGGGLILNNKVYRGVDSYAGELGHMIVVAEGRECTCGNKGCIEAYASATSIIKRIKDGIKKGYINSYNDVEIKEIDAKLIFDKAEKGDIYSIDAVDSAARYLGRLLGGIVNLLNLQAIIIGGGVSSSQYFIEKIKFYCIQVAWYSFTKNLKILPAKLWNDAGIIGAASLILEDLLEKSSCDNK